LLIVGAYIIVYLYICTIRSHFRGTCSSYKCIGMPLICKCVHEMHLRHLLDALLFRGYCSFVFTIFRCEMSVHESIHVANKSDFVNYLKVRMNADT